MPTVWTAPRAAIEHPPAPGGVVTDGRRNEVLVVVTLGIREQRAKEPCGHELGQEAPFPEHQGPEAEKQLCRHRTGVEEQDEPTGLEREEGEDLQRIVQVAEAFALSALHGPRPKRPSAQEAGDAVVDGAACASQNQADGPEEELTRMPS